MNVFLDNASTTPLSQSTKDYIIEIFNDFGNPSSLHSAGEKPKKIISDARKNVANFINADPGDIYFMPSGSAGNTLAVKGLTSEDPQKNQYEVFYSPTAHKSMLKACESCLYKTVLVVSSAGKIDLYYLKDILTRCNTFKPLVCIEAANSELGTMNDIIKIGSIVHEHNGLLVVDATGYIPSCQVDMKLWNKYVDILTFSGHKLNALKGVGILWKRKDIELKPLIYGSQENGLIGGTENVIGIASLGKAVNDYNYSSISSYNRDYVYNFISNSIPDCYLIGSSINSNKRLPHNLFMCFKGIEGESLMILLDLNGIQVSTGSACNSRSLSPSAALTAIGIDEKDIHSCVRFSFSGAETPEELDYVCVTLKKCITVLRQLNNQIE